MCKVNDGFARFTACDILQTLSVEYHVISALGGTWRVKRRGANRAASVHSTQGEAVVRARELAKKDASGTVFVHRVDGTVSRMTTYGKDPHIRREHSGTKK